MNLKEAIQKDNQAVFLNPDEFGELKNIDGVELMVVIDNDIINERSRFYLANESLGVFRSTITFFIRKDDLGYTPVENQLMDFDDKPYILSNVFENLGIFEITIEANES